MDPKQIIDAQFDRAVQIVQSLPKNGPIQTGYEEKLSMYSLYKQATTGNVNGPRPAMWDMLGRAKWDAWDKHKDLDSYEAKWLYVDALLRVLHRYSDKTVAQDLVRELESYGGGPEALGISGFSKSRAASTSSASSNSSMPVLPPQLHQSLQFTRRLHNHSNSEGEDDDTEDDRESILPLAQGPIRNMTQNQLRSPSSMSSNRYRTPLGGSLVMSPPPVHVGGSNSMFIPTHLGQQHTRAHIPHTQPMPEYETPSAFQAPAAALTSPPNNQHSSLSYRRSLHHHTPSAPISGSTYLHRMENPLEHDFGSFSPLERAVVSVQASLAAIQERLESLEAKAAVGTPTGTPFNSRSNLLPQRGRAPSRKSPGPAALPWYLNWDVSELDWDRMGMWSIVLSPAARTTRFLLRILAFLLPRNTDKPMSPGLVVLRRLLLDVSFTLCFMAIAQKVWQKHGMRRKEVVVALRGLWAAIVGKTVTGMEKVLVDKGV